MTTRARRERGRAARRLRRAAISKAAAGRARRAAERQVEQPELAGDAQPELAGDAQPELAGGGLDEPKLAGGGLDEPKPLTDAAKRKAGLIPPKGGKRRDAERRRMHGALGDIERAPAWLLAAYYDEIMDLERIAKDARHALAAQGIEPHDEYGS